MLQLKKEKNLEKKKKTKLYLKDEQVISPCIGYI